MIQHSQFASGGFVLHVREGGMHFSAWYDASGTLKDMEAFDRHRRSKRVSQREREYAERLGQRYVGIRLGGPTQYTENPMRRPSSDWNWREAGYGFSMPLSEAQAIWDRAYRKGPEPDPRKQFLAEARRKPKGPITRKDYERAIKAPLRESPVMKQRYRELEERYAERPLDIWTDEEYL